MRVFGSKNRRGKSDSHIDARKQSFEKVDSIWRRLRLAEERIASIEAQASTLRRDVNRIDKMVYRQAPSSTDTTEAKLRKILGMVSEAEVKE